VRGEILSAPRGENGFGYDPVFKPDGSENSFAEMTDIEKNTHSHRAIAVGKMVRFLKEHKEAWQE
jgi:XTP/dITP diphosphohydrolase